MGADSFLAGWTLAQRLFRRLLVPTGLWLRVRFRGRLVLDALVFSLRGLLLRCGIWIPVSAWSLVSAGPRRVWVVNRSYRQASAQASSLSRPARQAAAASATTARALSVTRTDDAHGTRAKASCLGHCRCFTGSRFGGCTLGSGTLGAFGFAGAFGR